jgi:hypothetical protein
VGRCGLDASDSGQSPVAGSSISVTDEVSHAYKTADKIMVLYILILGFYRGDGKITDY